MDAFKTGLNAIYDRYLPGVKQNITAYLQWASSAAHEQNYPSPYSSGKQTLGPGSNLIFSNPHD